MNRRCAAGPQRMQRWGEMTDKREEPLLPAVAQIQGLDQGDRRDSSPSDSSQKDRLLHSPDEFFLQSLRVTFDENRSPSCPCPSKGTLVKIMLF